MTGDRTRTLRFEATENGPEVSALLQCPKDARALMLLGHGAGTNMRYPLYEALADGLCQQRIATVRFNYPYSAQGKQTEWEESLDPLEVLLSTVRSAAIAATSTAPGLPLFAAGRSMSSQLVSLAVARRMLPSVRGVVLLAFPVSWRWLLDHPAGHLARVRRPMLFIHGNRDDIAPVDELQRVVDDLGKAATAHVIDEADHRFDVPEDSGRCRVDLIDEATASIGRWIGGIA